MCVCVIYEQLNSSFFPESTFNLFGAASLSRCRCPSVTLQWSDSLSCGGLQSLALPRPRALAGEEQSELGPELLVAHAVDEGAEEAWQDVDQNEGGEEDYSELVGQGPDEGHEYEGRHVGEHADEQLDAVQQDGVPRLPGRRSAAGGG